MVLIDEIEINITLPNSGLGIVAMQPYIDLSREEPPRWPIDKKDDQLSKIVRTLDISKEKKHTCEKLPQLHILDICTTEAS